MVSGAVLSDYSDASRAATLRLFCSKRRELTISERRTLRRIKARWRLAEWKRRRKLMVLVKERAK